MNFLTNLFGTIAGTTFLNRVSSGISHIPKDNVGGTIQIKGDTASWLGLKNKLMQKYAYDYCFPVASVVDRLAEYDITGTVEILRASGKGREDYATNSWARNMEKLLAQPNPLQSWEQFRGQQVVYKKVFGYCPVLPFVPAGMTPDNATSMVNIPPWLFEAYGTKNIFFISKADEIVKEYKVTILNKSFTLKPEQVFILEDSFMQNDECDYLLPQSRMVGLDMAVSNLCAAMEADNVLLKKKGPLGVWSHDAAAVKDSMVGYLPMSTDEKAELQETLQQYGLNLEQYQYIISRTAIKWLPTSFDVRQLGTAETVVRSEKAICHRYAFPYVLYEETDATFANSSEAAKGVFVTNVIPNSRKDINKYNKFFKASENNAYIKVDYSDIAALQEDKVKQAETESRLTDLVLKQYDNNVITYNQMLTRMGLETVADGDKLKKDREVVATEGDPIDPNSAAPVDIKAQAQANLKGSVGGVQGILQIQASVAQGITNYQAAIATLFEIYGFSEDVARTLLGPEKELTDPKLEPIAA